VTRRSKVAAIGGGILAILIIAAGIGYLLIRPSADRRAYGAIHMEWLNAGSEVDRATQNRFAERCLDVNRQYPGTGGAVAALWLATAKAPSTPAGQEATRLFVEQIETADLEHLARAFEYFSGRRGSRPQFANPLLARVRGTPDHPRCGRVLASCCWLLAPEEGDQPPAVFQEVADLLAERYADKPGIYNYCDVLTGVAGSPPWALQYERHLRRILEVNQDRMVRCAAHFALASVVLATGEERQSEALALFEQFCGEFDGTYQYRYQNFEQVYHTRAKTELNDLRFHAVGKLAPDIVGVDLDDRPLKLSDYRGRVVLLNFWGTWCFPCMKLVPHERELVASHTGRPFDIVGVNCADEVEAARAAAARTGITWRSFRNEAGGQPAITKEWKILGYPTLYLIDHHGTIRKRWVGGPTPEELEHMVKVLVDAAEKRVPAEEMKSVVATLAARPASTHPASSQPAPVSPGSAVAAVAARSGTGFLDKVYRDADGLESKYTVFVPPGYDDSKSVPAILYLHGAGPRGADGRAHLETGLAKAIRAKGLDFPFLVVFPQAREGEDWLAGTPGGRRALAILAQVQVDHRIDADRVALTGVSMGGAGTWSLAAADPKRWSAIVPICHGGDPASAAKLVGIPCWSFHGAADRVIPAQQSREMVEAITNSGGRPLYQEFPGVGHNDCSERVYAMNDLYEWLLMQDRSQR
jgi:poly(3-hydroxybutyrate) depolymerase/thiol-disulfide isomerase/thioredoxin